MKMDESYFKEKLSAYLDKDLSPEEMAMMDQYVREHEEARRILDEYKKLNDLVEKHSGLGESDYWERSARQIEEAIGIEPHAGVTDIQPKSRTGFVWKITAVAASVALLIFIGVHQSDILKRQQEEIQPSETSRAQQSAPSLGESVAVAESTQVFDAESVEESEAGEGTPTQAEVPPTPEVSDELGEVDKSVGVPAPPPEEQRTVTKSSPLHSSLSRKQSDLSKSIGVTPSPAAPNESLATDTLQIRGGRAGETSYVVDSEGAISSENYANLSQRAEEAGDTAYVIPQKLTSYQRDSMLTYYRSERELFMEKPSDIKPKIEQPSLTPGLRQEKPKERPKASATIQKPGTSQAPEDVKRMLTASYVVAMLSSDESEREEAFDYIKLVAEDTASVHNALAAEYLEALETRRIDQK